MIYLNRSYAYFDMLLYILHPAQGAHDTVRDNKRHPHTQTHNPKRAQEKTTRITTASRLSWNLADWRSASTSLDPYAL